MRKRLEGRRIGRVEREQDHGAERQQDESDQGFVAADEFVVEACWAIKHHGNAMFTRRGARRQWTGGIVSGLDGSENFMDSGHVLCGTPRVYAALAKLCSNEIKALLA